MFDRPDWTDASAYREIEKAGLQRIAWEFLRRNPAYQTAWQKYAYQVRSLVGVDTELARYAELILSANPTNEMVTALGDERMQAELIGRLDDCGFFAAVPDVQGRQEPLDRQYGSPWGLERITNPMQSYSPMSISFSHTGTRIMQPSSYSLRELEDCRSKSGRGPMDTKWLVLQIDLSLPAEVIESLVLWRIRGARKHRIEQGYFEPVKSRAVARARYVEYLRILDAVKAGVAVAFIGEKMSPSANNDSPDHPRTKRYQAALKEATRIQTEGYKVLPLLQQISGKNKKN